MTLHDRNGTTAIGETFFNPDPNTIPCCTNCTNLTMTVESGWVHNHGSHHDQNWKLIGEFDNLPLTCDMNTRICGGEYEVDLSGKENKLGPVTGFTSTIKSGGSVKPETWTSDAGSEQKPARRIALLAAGIVLASMVVETVMTV